MTSLIDRIAAVIWDHDQRGDYCLCGSYTGDKTHPNHVATILVEELGLDHYLPILPPQPGQRVSRDIENYRAENTRDTP